MDTFEKFMREQDKIEKEKEQKAQKKGELGMCLSITLFTKRFLFLQALDLPLYNCRGCVKNTSFFHII